MKIVLCGATGFLGTEILEQCIKHHYITHVYALTRKELASKYSTNPKVTQIVHENFDDLPDYLFERLRGWGVEGCIWALGGTVAKEKNLDTAQKVGISYPIAAAEGFAKKIAPEMMESARGNRIKPFRFIFISSSGAEQDQSKNLWYWNDFRKIKGAAEKGLFDVAENSPVVDNKRSLQVIALRAGMIIARNDNVTSILQMGVSTSIAVNILAHCAINLVQDGDHQGRKILENKDCLGDDWASINTLHV